MRLPVPTLQSSYSSLLVIAGRLSYRLVPPASMLHRVFLLLQVVVLSGAMPRKARKVRTSTEILASKWTRERDAMLLPALLQRTKQWVLDHLCDSEFLHRYIKVQYFRKKIGLLLAGKCVCLPSDMYPRCFYLNPVDDIPFAHY
jgi:hypothetical protein